MGIDVPPGIACGDAVECHPRGSDEAAGAGAHVLIATEAFEAERGEASGEECAAWRGRGGCDFGRAHLEEQVEGLIGEEMRGLEEVDEGDFHEEIEVRFG